MDGIQPTAVDKSGRPLGPAPGRSKTKSEVPTFEQALNHVRNAAPDAPVTASFQSSAGLVQTYLRFSVDDTGKVRVKVMNTTNDEVIREIPSEEVAQVAQGLRAYQQAALRRRPGVAS